MTGMMTITLPDHANTSQSSIQPVPLINVTRSLKLSLRRGTTNQVSVTDIKAFNVTMFQGKILNIQVNFTDPTSISVVKDLVDSIEVEFKPDSDLLEMIPEIYLASDFQEFKINRKIPS